MRKNTSHLFVISFLAIFTVACGQKTVTNNITTSSSNSSSSSSSSSTSTASCDGIARSGATSCYYKNLPEVKLNGPGTTGITYWSSLTDLSSYGISQNQFATDATFSVRMKPSYITDSSTSKQGRVCSPWMATNFTKMKLYVMLRKSGVSIGETAELTATADSSGNWSFSNTHRYSVPSGTTSPFILEVVGVKTNHRCLLKNGSTTMTYYGTRPSTCNSSEYMDIPFDSNTANPISCVGFKLQTATDDTYDLPN